MLDKTLIYQMTGGKDEGTLQEFIKEICWAVQLLWSKMLKTEQFPTWTCMLINEI